MDCVFKKLFVACLKMLKMLLHMIKIHVKMNEGGKMLIKCSIEVA
jgi:hypothetical protein